LLVHSDSAVYSGAEALLCEIVEGLAGRDRFELSCMAPADNIELFRGLEQAVGPGTVSSVVAQPTAVAALHLYDPRRRARLRHLFGGETWDVGLINMGSAEYGSTPLMLREPPWRRTLGLVHIANGFSEHFRLGRIRERLARRPMGRLDVVGVPSPSARERFVQTWTGGDKVVHSFRLPNPDVDPVPRAEAKRLLGLPEAPVVGIAGRISFAQKGHDTFVEAARILAGRRSEVQFAVAGRGQDEARLRRLIERSGLGHRTHLLGHVEPIERFLCALDAIAIPSRFEGLCGVALEAAAVGTPGVVADCVGLGDAWPERWTVEPDDPAALADRLDRVLAMDAAGRAAIPAAARSLQKPMLTDDVGGEIARIVVESAEGP
jgi:glycosyltransferase involved in cell wall biosynthesis